MSRFRFVHAADLHLDSPFRALEADAELRELFRESTFAAFSRVVNLCLRERVQFLALAGDLFDSRDRSVRARLALLQELKRLDSAGIQTFIVHGNHDPLSGAGYPSFFKSVTVFGASWDEVPVYRGNELICRVQGISYPQEHVQEDLSARFRRQGPEFTVGLLHTNVSGHAAHANYAPCAWDDLAARGLDYWALGHVHTRAERTLANGGVAVYPGNPQGRHAFETGERGCVLVEVDEGSSQRRFFATDVIRWHAVERDIEAAVSVEALLESAMEAIVTPCVDGFRAHAVRVRLVGRGPLHTELGRGRALLEFEAHLRERCRALQPPVLLEMVQDDSGLPLNLAELEAAGGLPAQVIEIAREAQRSGAAVEALWGEGGDELDRLDAMLRRLGVPTLKASAAALLDRAAERALESIEERG